MVKTIVWSESAARDLEKIIAYLYEDSPAFAHSFYYTTIDKARSLGEFPKRGRIVPELRWCKGTKSSCN